MALALEEAATEAAEAMLVTAAAVATAAARAADAASSAREARARAAQAAARSVAEETARTAQDVRRRADTAATRVHQAALLAAEGLGLAAADGLVPDVGRVAELLDATVRAAALGTAREADCAAASVAEAAVAAAAHVAGAAAAAEIIAESEVAARAEVQRELASAAARAVAIETHARAQGAALTARAAAADLLAESLPLVPALPGVPGDTGAAVISPSSAAVGRERAVSEVLAELTHDLLVPVASVVGSVEILRDELADHPSTLVRDLLALAFRAGTRMALMLDHTLVACTPGEPPDTVDIDLADVVADFVADSLSMLGSLGARVDVGPLPVLRADPDEIYSVMQNLITNAVKFARPGVPAVVGISARPTVDGWRISVRDNGVGLPAEGVDVFSMFTRGAGPTAGHGIGLATVARIIARHDGHVGVVRHAVGAEVYFDLPTTDRVVTQRGAMSGRPLRGMS